MKSRPRRNQARQRERGLVWLALDLGDDDFSSRKLRGFVVSRPGPTFKPVAFVRVADKESFRRAGMIAEDYSLAAAGGDTQDLRNCTVKPGGKAYPKWFGRQFLARLSNGGRVIEDELGRIMGMYNKMIYPGGRVTLCFNRHSQAFIQDKEGILAAIAAAERRLWEEWWRFAVKGDSMGPEYVPGMAVDAKACRVAELMPGDVAVIQEAGALTLCRVRDVNARTVEVIYDRTQRKHTMQRRDIQRVFVVIHVLKPIGKAQRPAKAREAKAEGSRPATCYAAQEKQPQAVNPIAFKPASTKGNEAEAVAAA